MIEKRGEERKSGKILLEFYRQMHHVQYQIASEAMI